MIRFYQGTYLVAVLVLNVVQMAKFIKDLKFGLEARDKVLKGMNILADAVGSTLGPRSRNEKKHILTV